jgi:transcriptional regulator of arginine metabolism
MTRSVRQSKILDIITAYEIETQEDLVNQLRAANFDVTQATISRDIKELGLIKILSSDSNKYKYAIVDSTEKQASNKYLYLFKESVISIKQAQNLVVIKTLKGMAGAISNMLDKFNIDGLMGSTYGDDTVMTIFSDSIDSNRALIKLNDLFNS